MGRRLGVMGGTFDPIHYGHLVTAEEALEQFELEGVLFVPTGRPWMKEHEVVSPAEDRYLMTVIATASNPLFSVSRIEVDRDGPTYTVETLRSLKGELDAELFFITGADAILEMIQWKQAGELFELARFIAATRPGYDMAGFEVPGAREGRGHRDEHPGAGDLLHRHPGPREGRRPHPLSRARGREELHREGRAVPVTAATRVSRSATVRRRRAAAVVAGVVLVAAGAYGVSRLGDAAGGGPTEPNDDVRSASPSELLVLQVTGTDDPLLAVIGAAHGREAARVLQRAVRSDAHGAGSGRGDGGGGRRPGRRDGSRRGLQHVRGMGGACRRHGSRRARRGDRSRRRASACRCPGSTSPTPGTWVRAPTG